MRNGEDRSTAAGPEDLAAQLENATDEEFEVLCAATWRRPPTSIEGLKEYAVVARAAMRKRRVWEEDPEKVDDWHDATQAHLIRAVLGYDEGTRGDGPGWRAHCTDIEGHLMRISGILYALTLIADTEAFNRPCPEYGALSALIDIAGEQAEEIWRLLDPGGCRPDRSADNSVSGVAFPQPAKGHPDAPRQSHA
jgi:hypothetical protein